jgi:hypothetical protein
MGYTIEGTRYEEFTDMACQVCGCYPCHCLEKAKKLISAVNRHNRIDAQVDCTWDSTIYHQEKSFLLLKELQAMGIPLKKREAYTRDSETMYYVYRLDRSQLKGKEPKPQSNTQGTVTMQPATIKANISKLNRYSRTAADCYSTEVRQYYERRAQAALNRLDKAGVKLSSQVIPGIYGIYSIYRLDQPLPGKYHGIATLLREDA